MNLWKSLLIGFGTYVVLTFLGNLLYAALTLGISVYFALEPWTLITTFFTGLDALNPISIEIYGGVVIAVSTLTPPVTINIVLSAIGAILIPIIPGLVAAILAGKLGQSSKNGFFSMLITGVAITIYPIVLLFVNPASVLGYIPLVSVVTPVPWLQAILTGIIGLLIGTFWGGLAAFFGRE